MPFVFDDRFILTLVEKIKQQIPVDFEYHCTAFDSQFKDWCKEITFTKSTVVLYIYENPELGESYGYYIDRTPLPGARVLRECLIKHPEKQFIVICSVNKFDEEINLPNVQAICAGGGILLQHDKYPTLEPLLDKNLDSTLSFISLNRHSWLHRITTLCYIFGTDLHHYGKITRIGIGPQADYEHPILEAQKKFRPDLHDQFVLGIDRLFKADFPFNYFIYKNQNDNFTNFKENLVPWYKNSFVEIVSETMFSSISFMHTEKFLHSVYGCNFPIVLSSAGAVEDLRSLGFDMFDDIVDHSYDQCVDSFVRIVEAIDSNRHLLTDVDNTKKLWVECKPRFENNVNVAKQIYATYSSRVEQQIKQLKF